MSAGLVQSERELQRHSLKPPTGYTASRHSIGAAGAIRFSPDPRCGGGLRRSFGAVENWAARSAAQRSKAMGQDKFDKGLQLRKQVLGADYVERSMAGADEFSRPMQELSTEYCWGHVWTRPGLALRDRSLINLGMISALNRPHELKLHVKAALNNGVTREEIREVLLQVAVYCGVPAGMDSVRIAREAFAELDQVTQGK